MRIRVSGDGPLILKVPGLIAGVELFREEMDRVIASGFRVAALDNTGDRRDDPTPLPVTWEGYAAEIDTALDRLGERHAVLWGTSFGSLVCLAAAGFRPERVAGMLLCCPPDPAWRPALWVKLYRWASSKPNAALHASVLFQTGFGAMNLWELMLPTTLARLPRLVRVAREANTPPATILHKLELLFANELPLPDGSVPSTIVAGAWDLVTPSSGARRLASALPGCQLHVLPASGHSLAYSHPHRYAELALKELCRICDASGHGRAS